MSETLHPNSQVYICLEQQKPISNRYYYERVRHLTEIHHLMLALPDWISDRFQSIYTYENSPIAGFIENDSLGPPRVWARIPELAIPEHREQFDQDIWNMFCNVLNGLPGIKVKTEYPLE